jgi:hypothetical protein
MIPLPPRIKFPASLTKLSLFSPCFVENRFGALPVGLTVLYVKFDVSAEDGIPYQFDTLDITGLPSSLRHLALRTGYRSPEIKLIGQLPSSLVKISLSKGLSVESGIRAGVEQIIFS